MSTIAAENKFILFLGQSRCFRHFNPNTYVGLPEIAMNDFRHTQLAYPLVVLIDRENNGKGMWFQCEQPFLWGEHCVTS